MERCIFCGWNRRSAFPSIRFFMIPREPGMKQLMWMHAIDKKCSAEGQRYEQSPRDRVCSVHFRQGRPSSDMSHEDFAPHLYLTTEPPAEVLNYLENLAEAKSNGGVMPVRVKHEAVTSEYKAHVNSMNPGKIEVSKISRPSILQRKRKKLESPPTEEKPSAAAPEPEEEEEDEEEDAADYTASAPDMFAASHPDHRMAPSIQRPLDPPGTRSVRLQRISREAVEAIGARPGQTITIKKRVKSSRASSMAPQ